jgi:DNA polymerase/3'-5' exonuclease PolX
MSTTGQKIPYAAALEVAQALRTALDLACDRTLIAGSLRRQKTEVGDLELVIQPKAEPILDMFGAVVGQQNLLDERLAVLGITTFTKNGERYKQFTWEGISVDLFVATPETWGCVATIRTGSADFTRWLVTKKRQGGACPEMYSFKGGRIWAGSKALDTSEERHVFDLLELDWIEPAARIGWVSR